MVKNYSDLSTIIASWTRKVSLSLLIVISCINPSFAQVKNVEIIEAIPERNESKVTLRIKAYDQNNKPVRDLQKENFNLTVCPPKTEPKTGECQTLNPIDINWKIPLPEELPPAWVIVLLDFSGSMKQLDSSGEKTKLEGAIAAIRKFNQDLADKGENTKISIVPFGKGGKNCPGNQVTKKELDNFVLAGNKKVEQSLKKIESQLDNLCAATDIYEPLRQAVQFFGNSEDTRFNPRPNSNLSQPRRSIILLSDGYHSIYGNRENEPELEAQDFEKLVFMLKSYPNITVHTLGYGLTPQQLQQKYDLEELPTIRDISVRGGKKSNNYSELTELAAEEFVDQKRLQQIAGVTNGIAEFSGNAEDISSSLTEFLEALFDEYQINYIQPINADRGSLHNVQVSLNLPNISVDSEQQPYVFPWVSRSLPFLTRFIIFLFTLAVLLGGGVIPFLLWAKSIKREYQ
ncbi:VWA domain-containing protein [Okeania hirsuta]|uniref:VWA domain-containing protein n=1 Tax=Okeania hirsuta TaxID=1458930 RepID=A0A3N6R5K3_9CYAN|nr:VWA domain-containing protein [Okeania sp. SIO2B9]NET75046.1 VWA domain-containing protein [Okeania sp. SIO1F9]RQH26106.1 VWA domain-containing protein [Okeania hirsuta]RQH48217.1 VWA domain-containing protein [Okeania hirsuta]